jgi:hypothetical protein
MRYILMMNSQALPDLVGRTVRRGQTFVCLVDPPLIEGESRAGTVAKLHLEPGKLAAAGGVDLW